MNKISKGIGSIQKLGPVLGLLLIIIILSVMSPSFTTADNILNVLRQVSINALIAFGMTFVILTGGIDLSVGSILALSSALTAGMLASGMDPVIAVLLGLLAGALMGLVNGVIIAKGKVAPFIATLATMTIFRGLTLVYTEGRPITGLSDAFSFQMIGKGYFLGVPFPVVTMLLAYLFLYFLLKKTTFGRGVYAIGGNEEAAKLSGLKVDRLKMGVYAISGLFAAVAGITLTSRLDSAQPTAGTSYELDAIAAVVLGGTSLSGGRGWIFGTLIGALIIGVLNNGLNLLNVSSFYQQVVKGGVILLAVLIDRKKAA
ncbi:ribose ABC transporter permease [Cytobacillus sp. FSL W7-1323]|uniref:Ribose ABC transporter permease n=1 Tax=Cytobacillus kochii TaxID=859143 RepID=A0A248TMQ6_9BACI|nr:MULTISPECIES: ribose ABC transporter permease [Cytobacillus]ASV69370.1 ribose ABC transporter permease [Cytobacillus kochii]MCA1027307.1 ribose ABC transporter permease [Cytobacillus kochii]MCM3320971.1 ribose ABC transporter permease [Cytobacillus kochii]MCM3344196.1 ribose ABC transporter permease [Cytobacillus kochii]MDM5208039.1 ribose ABC transporter permease [Cytobacillus kochii]